MGQVRFLKLNALTAMPVLERRSAGSAGDSAPDHQFIFLRLGTTSEAQEEQDECAKKKQCKRRGHVGNLGEA